MREFDCSNVTQLQMLRAKIKHLFNDYVESETFKILDLSHVNKDKNLQSHCKKNQTTNKLSKKN